MRTTSKTPNNLRAIRARQGWTVAQVGAAAGVDPSYIARLERGERSPTLGVARRVARALGVDIAAIWPVGNEPVRAEVESEDACVAVPTYDGEGVVDTDPYDSQ